jgi:type IV pilus assembly protein PilQ
MRARAAVIPLLTLLCAAGAWGGWSTSLMARAQDAAAQVPAATRLTAVQVGATADGVTVTLRGNGRLSYSAIQEADRPPARLVIDFQGVRPEIAPSTTGQGVLRRVRAALNNPDPLVTRIVLDLERMVSHRMRPSADGRELVVTLEAPPPAESTAAAASASPPPAPASSAPAAAPVEAPRAAAPSPTERVATSLSGIVLGETAEGVTVTFKGNGRLEARPIEQGKGMPPRLVLDLPGVRPAVPATTRVGKGLVDRVRVAQSSQKPAVTRVTLQMTKQFLYRLRASQTDAREVTITIADPQNQPDTAAEFVLAEAVGPAAKAPAPAASAPQRARATLEPAPAATSPEPLMQVGSGAGKGFTGHPVSLDFQGVDLRAVLRTFSEITGLNVVIDPGVKGSVDVSLREVPWDQALDIILRANQLGYSVEGTIVRIAPLDVLSAEEGSRRRLKEEQDLSGEIKTFTRSLSYAKAREMTVLLQKTSLTKRGTIEIDERTNTVILTDLEFGLDRARHLIDTLDTPQPQVEIEARIIETRASYRKELGIRLGLNGSITPALGNTLPLTFPNQGTVTAGTGTVTQTAPTLAGIVLGSVNGAFSIDATLSALETEGKAKVISAPRVIMQNNIEGEILQGSQIPYTTAQTQPTGDGVISAFQVPTVQFKDAALKLTVKPRITASGTIIMDVNLERSAPNYTNSIAGNPNPAIDTQKAKTTVQVTDGATAAIGGIMFEDNNTNDDRTPGLSRLPVIGKLLFHRRTKSTETRELVLLITPKIVKG